MELQFIDISRDENTKSDIQKGKREISPRTIKKQKMHSQAEYKRKRRKKRRIKKWVRLVFLCGILLGIVLFCCLLYTVIRGIAGYGKFANVLNEEKRTIVYQNETKKPVMTEDFLPVNPNSRPGYALYRVDNIFVHYTANPGTSAAQNRSYFENLATTKETSASAHFIIGYEGEIIQCLPLEEIGYAVKTRNQDSLSIECCYLQEDGKFTENTYKSLVILCAWLLNEYNLTPDDILRHYDEGGKKCPLYYVEHEDAWEQFKKDVRQEIIDSKDK